MFDTVEYDPDVIQEFAEKLYAKARNVTVTSTIVYGMCGAISGLLMGYFAKLPDSTTVLPVVGLLVMGGIGYSMGATKAFTLRLQAQTALCQMQIERNTQSNHVLAPRGESRMDLLYAKRKNLPHQSAQAHDESMS